MKITLINPPTDFDVTLGKIKSIAPLTKTLPVGVASVAGFLQHQGVDVEVIDSYAEELSIEQTVDRASKGKPSVVGISCVTPVVPIAYKIAEGIKRADRDIKIALGGIHPTLFPDECLKHEDIDFVVRYEGEYTCYALIKALDNNDDLTKVNGLSFKENGRIINNPPRNTIKDLDSLPMPAYDLLPMSQYRTPPMWEIWHPTFQVNTSRGCPFKCTFCAGPNISKVNRSKSVTKIIEEIEHLTRFYNAKGIMFTDPVFPFSHRHAIKLCDALIESGLNKKIRWTTETRIDLVDEELLGRMYLSGCRLIFYGIESGVQKTLDAMKKGITLEQIERAVCLTKRAGIKVYGNFILGMPNETYEDCLQTIEFARNLELDFTKFSTLVPYPGTAIYDQVLKDGSLKSCDWSKFSAFAMLADYEPVYCPNTMTAEDLRKLQKLAFRRCYLRPKVILKKLFQSFSSFRSMSSLLFTGKVFVSGILMEGQTVKARVKAVLEVLFIVWALVVLVCYFKNLSVEILAAINKLSSILR